jgi:hypothetical protein
MSAYTISLCGLPDVDKSSLKSMLKLSKTLLTHEWEIIESSIADLSIYSFDTEEGKTLWQQREVGQSITALLTTEGDVTEPVDVVLKKPLRTSNFSDALNLVEDKINFRKQAEKVSQIVNQKQEQDITSTIDEPQEEKSSIFSSFSKFLGGKKGPSKDLPELNLHLPTERENIANTITDPELLAKWLKSIEAHDNHKKISQLLANLLPLNRVNIPASSRIVLLEQYRFPIQQVLQARDVNNLQQDLDSKSRHDIWSSLNLLVEELAIGYKYIVDDCYKKGDKPSSSKLYLFSINRMAEQLGLQIIHCFQHYLSAPEHVFFELNQFYLYLESDRSTELEADYKSYQSNKSFFQIYAQIMLTAIADPYRLARFEVLRLYKLMEKMASHVEIELIPKKEIQINSSLLMSGHYCIDCETDYHPTPMSKTVAEVKEKPSTRLFNTQPVLLAIEQIFKKTAQTASQGAFDLDVKTLKKIIPQLNTSYERKFDRKPIKEEIYINIANGSKKIHDCIKKHTIDGSLPWKVHNQHQNGIMLSRDTSGLKHIDNGDFVGVLVEERPVMLGVIRWLNINNNNTIHIGIELFDGEAVSVICTSEEGETNLALLSPGNKEIKQESTIIGDKGLFSPGRRLRVSGDGEPYIIGAETLVDNTFNYEQFTYKKYKPKPE